MSVYASTITIQTNDTRQITYGPLEGFIVSYSFPTFCYENKNIFGRIIQPVYQNGYYLCEFHEYVAETDSFDHSEVTATVDIGEAEKALGEFAKKHLKKGQTATELIDSYFKGIGKGD